jgi:hypothetical protein
MDTHSSCQTWIHRRPWICSRTIRPDSHLAHNTYSSRLFSLLELFKRAISLSPMVVSLYTVLWNLCDTLAEGRFLDGFANDSNILHRSVSCSDTTLPILDIKFRRESIYDLNKPRLKIAGYRGMRRLRSLWLALDCKYRVHYIRTWVPPRE